MSQNANGIRLCARDVRNHRICQEMASISHRATLSHFYGSEESENLLAQTIQTPEQQKWASKLQGFSFDISYKPGKANLVADALSRKYVDPTSDNICMTLSSTLPALITSLQQYYSEDSSGKELVAKVEQDVSMFTDYWVTGGLVYFKNKIFIPDAQGLRQAIISEFHNTPLAGHSGLQPTLARLAASFT